MSVKKQWAAVVLGMGAAGAFAQSSVSLYGVIDLAVGSVQYAGAAGGADNTRTTKIDSNTMTTSFIGFKGIEDLGGGLKVGFAIESFLRPDTGASGRFGTDPFWGRAAFVSIQNDLGKLTLGRQGNLLFSQVAGYNPLGGAFGVSPAVRLTFGKWGNDLGDSGWSNALTYQSPNWAGLTGTVQLQAPEVSGKDLSYGLGLSYVSGPFAIAGAWQDLRSATAPKTDLTATQKQSFGLLSSSYDFGVAKLFAQVGEFSNKGFVGASQIKTSLFQLGASVPVSKDGKVLVSYGQSKEKPVDGGVTPVTKHTIFTLGYDHYLSKRTDLYGMVMLDDEKGTGFKKGTTYLVGVRHAF